jgi:hypothetical protein
MSADRESADGSSVEVLPGEVPVHELWWLHDARWYQGVLKRFGQEAANEINAEAIKFVARRSAMWYRKHSGLRFDEIPMDEFIAGFEHIPALMWTESMYVVEQTQLGEDEWETVVSRNFALQMLRIARTLDGYECPCLKLREGWFEGMGVAVSDTRIECLQTGASGCRFRAVRKRPEKEGGQQG